MKELSDFGTALRTFYVLAFEVYGTWPAACLLAILFHRKPPSYAEHRAEWLRYRGVDAD